MILPLWGPLVTEEGPEWVTTLQKGRRKRNAYYKEIGQAYLDTDIHLAVYKIQWEETWLSSLLVNVFPSQL